MDRSQGFNTNVVVVVNTTASYSGGLEFKSRPGDRLSWLRILLLFLRPSTQIPGSHLKLNHDRFLPHTSKFIIYLSSFHRRY